jgi:superfamily II DNA or RNA helicase/HKD family nuclease
MINHTLFDGHNSERRFIATHVEINIIDYNENPKRKRIDLMEPRNGLFEELMLKNKQYPESKRSFPLHPQQYADALIQQISRDIGERIHNLAQEGSFDEMFALANNIRQQINSLQDELRTPLQAVHYNLDERPIPVYPEMFLTNPELITNDGLSHSKNLYKMLKFELLTADAADFMVSFIRWSGLQLLLRPFDELNKQNKRIRILTSTYMKITEPKALQRLLELDNVEVKIYSTGNKSFHTKAYMFNRSSGMDTTIIGSSNMSKSALESGYEWNVKLPNSAHIPVGEQAHQIFEQMWADEAAIPLTSEFLQEYKKEYDTKVQRAQKLSPIIDKNERIKHARLLSGSSKSSEQPKPSPMQKQALESLYHTRANGYTKGVIIAATGTGKTYLSAFDVQQFDAKKLLFLAHRDELLENAKDTFEHVFRDTRQYGKLTGTVKEWDRPFLFSTVQTMYRDDVLSKFSRDHFDYLIVDEFHHAQADTYRKVLDHFHPEFLLGLTATPERLDGRDVLALCEHNVVHEVRLREALEQNLLAPFHYFGVYDETVNYEDIETKGGLFNEEALVKALSTHKRADFVRDMIEKYKHDGEQLKAIGFCARVDHATFMATKFTDMGYEAIALSGNDIPAYRQEVIRRLENDEDPLQIIFSVDILNEGVDIPKLNMLLFLRPTESATIFIQQLGRGLRKVEGKEYVTVLDFIGNYQKSFVVPLALSGQINHRAFDRDSLRVAVESEFADLPAGCYVDLEEVSRQQILEKLDNIRMDSKQMLMDLYKQFRKELGRSPELEDFLYTENAPSLVYFLRKYGTWVETKLKMDDLNESDRALLASGLSLEIVQRLEQMLPLKWPYEFVILHEAINNLVVTPELVITELKRRFGSQVIAEQQLPYIERAMTRLTETYKKQKWAFGQISDGSFILDQKIRTAWCDYLQQRLEYGLIDFRRTYKPDIFFENQTGVVPYQNYTREDLMFLFKSNAKPGSWREGISKVDNHYLLFINLNKDDNTAEHLQYHDFFYDQKHFSWQSSNPTSHESERGQEYVNHKERDTHIHLFVRKFEKMHGMTLPFTYLGEVDYITSHGDKPMTIKWRLHNSIPDDLFNDLIR